MIEILLPTFILLIALVMIHSVFGTKIIQRGIIFTDLAIGQWAALGVALSLLLAEGQFSFLFALIFALMAAFMIQLVSHKPYQEASIGLIYALGFSLIFLVMNHSAHGVELFLKLTASDLLFTDMPTTLLSLLIYSIIGLLFFLLDRYVTNAKYYDLFFFSLFALTVTHSVQVAGVFVVFSLLIVPSFISLIMRRSLYFSWLMGIGLSYLALIASYIFDLPTGYMIVALLSFSGLLTLMLQKKAA